MTRCPARGPGAAKRDIRYNSGNLNRPWTWWCLSIGPLIATDVPSLIRCESQTKLDMGLMGTLWTIVSILCKPGSLLCKKNVFSSEIIKIDIAQMPGRFFWQMIILVIIHAAGIYWMPPNMPHSGERAKNRLSRHSQSSLCATDLLRVLSWRHLHYSAWCFICAWVCFTCAYWSLTIWGLQSLNV